jgi:transcriptional regulator with XRE-family HTH domain
MLGEIVRSTRIRRGLTQAKLARLAGVSRRHLAALEKGANVSINVLRKVASVLELAEIDLGGVSLRNSGAGADPNLNVPLLADTIREARADASRAQTLLARAEGLLASDGDVTDALQLVAQFPRMPIRRVDPTGRGAGIADGDEVRRVTLSGEIRHGQPLDENVHEVVLVPSSLISEGELLFRVRGDALHEHGIEEGDLLIVELRTKGRASTGELVLARIGTLLYVGRWWQKHGHRAVMGNSVGKGTTDVKLQVIAAVTQVLRSGKPKAAR